MSVKPTNQDKHLAEVLINAGTEPISSRRTSEPGTELNALMNASNGNGSTKSQNGNSTNTKEPENIRKRGVRRYIGLLFAASSAFLSSLAAIASKILLQRSYHPINIALFRYQAITLAVPLYMLYLGFMKKQNVFEGLDRKTFFYLTVRGTLGSLGQCVFLYAVLYLNIADVIVITMSTPITVTLFARICLSEPCGIIAVITSLVTLGGVIVLSRPPLLTGAESFDTQNLIGILLALTCMVMVSCMFVVLRFLRTVHFTLPIFFYGFVGSVQALIAGIAMGVLELPRTTEDWVLTGGAAMLGLVAQILITLALKYEEAGPIALVRTLDIVFAFILQLIFFGIIPDIFSIVGALIITIGIFVTTFRKWLTTLNEKHPARDKYWFMLK